MNNDIALIKPIEMQELDVRVVALQKDFTAVLSFCQQLSGLEDKEMCGEGRVFTCTSTLSRVRNKSKACNFPQDNLLMLMDICGNEAPLIWLADRRGYKLVPKETKWERIANEERTQRLAIENELWALRKSINGRRAF
ncbi:hypothetical protein [Glaciimonas immobilis]|uniref:Uncharacterized protein n=1 Tax=Glaciimonas immobilis TaxID=728004 RepID=A0A840RSM2_9BURK|nr:hypothetical protein [Glaciimonas immobilis]KAF3997514.1 hypothetical protein HAV38_12610 [Glaciimonas immobilis]MBB5200805.1 hypothetical protein [Glaciimonas immobilis]